MIDDDDKPRHLNYAVRLVKEHSSADVVYWTAEDGWTEMYHAHAERVSEESIRVMARHVGQGFMPGRSQTN